MRRASLGSMLALATLCALPSRAVRAQAPRFARVDLAPPIERATGDPPADAHLVTPPAMPGAIVTTPLALVAPIRATEGSYVVLPAADVRVFGGTTGSIHATGADTIQLPLTYSIPRARAAGRAKLARVVVRWNDGTTWILEVEADVRPRHGLHGVLSPESNVALRGQPTVLRLMVSNLGNTADTLSLRWNAGGDWRLDDAPLVLIVPAGATLVRAVMLRCPHTAIPGEVHIAQVTATGRGGSVNAAASVRVGYGSSGDAARVEAPSTIFLGTTLGDDGAVRQEASLESEGELAPDTYFSLVARRRERGMTSPVLAGELGGRGFRLAFRRRALSAAVGDVWRPGSALTGLVAQGRGIDVAWRDRRLDAGVLLARPNAADGSPGFAQAGVGFATAAGHVGASFSHIERAGALPADSGSVQSAGLTFTTGERGWRFASVELGALRIRDAAGRTTIGMGVDGELERTSDRGAFAARVHAIPSAPAARDLLPSAAFLSGSFAVTDHLRALGTGSAMRVRSELGVLRAEGASAGASIQIGAAQTTLLANLRHLSAGGDTVHATTGSGASLALSVPVKAVTFDAYAEHGTSLSPDAVDRSDLLRGGVRWSGAAGWFWIGATWARSGAGSLTRNAEVSGAYRVGRAELQAGTNALVSPRLAIPGPTTLAVPSDELQLSTFWSRLTVDATRELALVGGVAYQHQAVASPWRISFGVRHRLALPLPIRRAPLVQGAAYEDRNGNRRRDHGEPGLAGVGLSLGIERAITAPDGRFAFDDRSLRGQTLGVDVASLPAELMLPPDAKIRSAGHVDIPFVRAAALTVRLTVDANGDGAADDDSSAGAGILVTVTDSAGRALDSMTGDDGTARFRGLIPGHYTVTVSLPAVGPRVATTHAIEIDIPPGAAAQVEIALPSTRREVRFAPGA